MHERWRLLNEGGLAIEMMDCNRLVLTRDRRVGIVRMVGTVGELGGDWGMDSDIVWDEELGGGVRGEDVEKVGCGDSWDEGAGE